MTLSYITRITCYGHGLLRTRLLRYQFDSLRVKGRRLSYYVQRDGKEGTPKLIDPLSAARPTGSLSIEETKTDEDLFRYTAHRWI
jgi:hypothetical protein